MGKAKTPEQKAADAKAKADAKLSGASAVAKAKSVDVHAPDGSVIRTYSKERHGDGFLDHANEFASKVVGRKVVASE